MCVKVMGNWGVYYLCCSVIRGRKLPVAIMKHKLDSGYVRRRLDSISTAVGSWSIRPPDGWLSFKSGRLLLQMELQQNLLWRNFHGPWAWPCAQQDSLQIVQHVLWRDRMPKNVGFLEERKPCSGTLPKAWLKTAAMFKWLETLPLQFWV